MYDKYISFPFDITEVERLTEQIVDLMSVCLSAYVCMYIYLYIKHFPYKWVTRQGLEVLHLIP